MKKILYLTPLILLASCYQAERNCTDYKTGKFRFEYEVDGQKTFTEFERRDSIEIEYYQGKVDSSYVRWVNDCEYILQKINPKNRQEKKAVQMKILTTTENSYTFEFSIVGDTQKQKGTAVRID